MKSFFPMTRAQLRLFHFFLTNFERTRCSRPQVTHSLTRRSACGQSTGSSTGWRWQTRARSTSSSTNASSTRATSVFSQKTQRSFASASCNHAAGGGPQFANRATNMSVFGTENPTVATPIREGWIGISDRHYLIGPATRQIELSYEHRLAQHVAAHERVGSLDTHRRRTNVVVRYLDIHNVVQHHNITLRTVGTVDTVSLDE